MGEPEENRKEVKESKAIPREPTDVSGAKEEKGQSNFRGLNLFFILIPFFVLRLVRLDYDNYREVLRAPAHEKFSTAATLPFIQG